MKDDGQRVMGEQAAFMNNLTSTTPKGCYRTFYMRKQLLFL